MCGILEVLISAPPVLLLAMLLYAVVDREQIEESVERKLQKWDS